MTGKIFPEFEIAYQLSNMEKKAGLGQFCPEEIEMIILKINSALNLSPSSGFLLEQKDRATGLIGRLQDHHVGCEIQKICDKTHALIVQSDLFLAKKTAKNILKELDALMHSYAISSDQIAQLSEVKKMLSSQGLIDVVFDPDAVEYDLSQIDINFDMAALDLMDMGGDLYQQRISPFYEKYNQMPEALKRLLLTHIEHAKADLTLLQFPFSAHFETNLFALLQAIVRCCTHLVQKTDLKEMPNRDFIEALFKEAQEYEELLP
ncbi:MAG: hypothetical protein K9M07_07530 [Simkaniaceae bacterium]|nr:hypothetical protein [Simkaniaceae bacterium]MCF7853073.1 hypothetical protein [Simkaniaceae bacterium]